MYESFFGLREKPFQLTPDPDYLYLSEGHSDVLAHLAYALQENQGFVAITGEVGSGKTTLVHHLLRNVEQRVRVGVLNNAAIPAGHFLRAVCEEFEVAVAGGDGAEALHAFNRFLVEEFAANRRVLLIVDEAQALPDETLEEARLLSNLQTEKHFLIQIVLLGQPELRGRIRQKSLEQLRQRITVQYHLGPMKPEEVGAYIRHRLKVAGSRDPGLFDAGAVEEIGRFSGGIPRLINVVCDAALVAAFVDGRKTVTREMMASVAAAWQTGGTLEAPQVDRGTGGPGAELELSERLDRLERRLQAAEEGQARQEKRVSEVTDRVRVLVAHLKAAKHVEQRAAEVDPSGAPPRAPSPPAPDRFFVRLRKLFSG